jgi:hypothetical protein
LHDFSWSIVYETLILFAETEPIFTLPASGGTTVTLDENSPTGTVVYTFNVADEDALPSATTVTVLSINPTGNDGLFVVDGSTLKVGSSAVLNFEGTASYSVVLR